MGIYIKTRKLNCFTLNFDESSIMCACRSAIVIGAGIAGQSAALALGRNGFRVKLYERFVELLDPVGAGIGLNGGALCLTQLGYRHIWEDISTPIKKAMLVSPSGSQAEMLPLHLLEGTKMEDHFVCMKRNHLINSLYNACNDAPNIDVKLGWRAHTYDQTEEEATVTFFDGSTDSADVIVCADGIHSTGKDYIIGDDELAAPTHSGYCVYYGIVPQPWAYKIIIMGKSEVYS